MKASLVESAPAATVLHVRRACGFLERARGLLARPAVAPGCGLLLHGVNAVHGFGMCRAIDLVFLDDRCIVLRSVRLAPWRIARCAAASAVLEMRSCILMLASAAATLGQEATAADAGPSGRPAAVSSIPASTRARTLDPATLRRFEAEADALYRGSAPQVAETELVRLYESLAPAAPQRRTHAWLRIGNIHQRAGAVGAAMDAYRKALHEADADAQPAAAADSRRKALLNLASLALEQARQALASLPPSLPTAGGHVEQLETLSRRLDRSSPRSPPPSAIAAPAAATREAAYVVERYTASARRNSVKAAKGSLHVDPDDELPARPLSRPRSRARERLPDVEYLLGDPQRSQKTVRDREAAGVRK